MSVRAFDSNDTTDKDLIAAADKIDPADHHKSKDSRNPSESNFAAKLADKFQDEQNKEEETMAEAIEREAKKRLKEIREKKLKDVQQREIKAKQKAVDDEEKLRIKEEYELKVKARVLHWMQMEIEENESDTDIYDPVEKEIVDRAIKKRVEEQLAKIAEEKAQEAEKKKREKEILKRYEKLIENKVSLEVKQAEEYMRRKFDEDSAESLELKKGEKKQRGGRNKSSRDNYYRWDGNRGGRGYRRGYGGGYGRGYFPDRRDFY